MHMRLLTIGYDLQDRTMGGEELLSLVEEGNRRESPELEGPLQEKRRIGGGWEDNCLTKFSRLLGFSTEGFKGEILNLLQRIKSRREKSKKKVYSVTTMFDRELKRLECSINYNKGKKGNGLDR